MFRPIYYDAISSVNVIDSRLSENPGCSLVYSPDSLSFHTGYLYNFIDTPRPKKTVSIVICTYGRPESLNETLKSLAEQTFKDFEVLLITEKGNLAELRDKGLNASVGRICSFIDDDVYCPPTWLQGVVESFGEGVLGVSGPTTITSEYIKNRDCFKYQKLRKFQEWLFKVPFKPGTLSPCGAPSMASNYPNCQFEGEVQYLECCNMSVLKEEAIKVGGFDHSYIRTGEWCEVDLSLKLKAKGKLYFSGSAGLEHRPSKAGIYRSRLSTDHRWKNFVHFQRKWVKPSIQRKAYWSFIWTYFKVKQLGWV